MKHIKKIVSAYIALSIMLSIAVMPTVSAAVDSYIQNFTGATIDESTGLPKVWDKLSNERYTVSSELVNGAYGKAADDSALKITHATEYDVGDGDYTPFRAIANLQNETSLYSGGTTTLIDGSFFHFTASVAACDDGFYNLGIYTKNVKVKYTPVGGVVETPSGELSTGNTPILGFTKDGDRSTVKLTAWGEDITPEGFTFKTKTWYKLDVIFNGITNTMDTYLDGKFIKTVDITDNLSVFSAYNDETLYSGWYLHYLQFIGVICDRYKLADPKDSAGMFDNVGFGNYYYGAAKPTISPMTSDLRLNGSAVSKDRINLPSGVTVSQLQSSLLSSNTLVFINSSGQVKADSDILAEGDRVVERSNNGELLKYYDIKIENGVLVGNKLTFENYNPNPIQRPDANEGSLDLPKTTDGTNAFAIMSAFNAFYLYAPAGVFGKADNDKCLRIWNVNASTTGTAGVVRTGQLLWKWPADVTIEQTKNIHISADIAADNTNFNELGLYNEFNNRKNIKAPFCFKKNGDNVDICSFGEEILKNYDFKINQFYKVDLIYVGNSKKLDIWINGEYISQVDFSQKLADEGESGYSKLTYFETFSNYVGVGDIRGNTYYDNLYVETFANNGYPAIEYNRGSNVSFDSPLTENEYKVYSAPDSTATQILSKINTTHTAKLFNKDYSAEVTGSTKVKNDFKIVEYANDGETMFYKNVILPIEFVSLTRSDDETKYTYSAKSLFANSGEQYTGRYLTAIAAYIDEQNLYKANFGYVTLDTSFGDTFTNTVSLDIDKDDFSKISKVKAFIWDDSDYSAMVHHIEDVLK